MNAVNSVQTSAVQGGSEEPSMEEILASIRRIIADDNSLPRPVGGSHATGTEDRGAALDATLRHAEPAVTTDAPEPTGVLHPHPLAPVEPRHDEPEHDDALEDEAAGLAEPVAEPSLTSVDDVEDDAWHDAELSHGREPLPDSHGTVSAPQFPTPEGPMSHPIPRVFPNHEERFESPVSEPVNSARPGIAALGAVDAPVFHAQASSHEDRFGDDLVEHEPARTESLDAEPVRAEPLLSAAADSAVAAAFNTLAASRLIDKSETLMELTREMLRPMVQAWVEQHLPAMVERFVVEEIERIAGKRR